ncbi:MAG: tetratricopeptide repeat protein [Deltaproteobacteria bacterium]|nr:tetratricopeptide repeat protein [Deltaproteobacteria bacterium]
MNAKTARHWFPQIIILLSATFAIYSGTINYPFCFDDFMYVTENYFIRDLSNFWPPSGTRYFGYLSFALNYRLGGLETSGYHAVNILIHGANSIMAFMLMRSLFKSNLFKRCADCNGAPFFFIPFAASLLFAAHPVQTEAVTYITQRFASLATLFYLLTLVLYFRWRSSLESGRFRIAAYALMPVLAVFAQMTKEISFTLPFMAVFFELLLFKGTTLPFKKRVIYMLPMLASALTIPMFLLAWQESGEIAEMIRALQVKELSTLSRHDYLLTQLAVMVTYLRLLVMPINQNFDYEYPIYDSFTHPHVFLSFIFIIGIFISGIALLYSGYRKPSLSRLAAGIGIIWFFATISVESSVIPIQHVIFEHRLYLPSAGAALFFSTAFFSLYGILRTRTSFTLKPFHFSMAILLAAAPLGSAAIYRNAVWKDPVTLYEDLVKKSPGKVPGHVFLARAYAGRGEFDKAIAEFQMALRIDPKDADARVELGNAYNDAGMVDEAMQEYRHAIEIRPGHVFARNNLGSSYLVQGRPDEAIAEYLQALRLDNANAETHYNLWVAYTNKGKPLKAQAHYQRYLAVKDKRK